MRSLSHVSPCARRTAPTTSRCFPSRKAGAPLKDDDSQVNHAVFIPRFPSRKAGAPLKDRKVEANVVL